MDITQDELTFYLSGHVGACQVGGFVQLYVPDVYEWDTGLQSKGINVAEPPSESLMGLRMMTVVDPDGNPLRIA